MQALLQKMLDVVVNDNDGKLNQRSISVEAMKLAIIGQFLLTFQEVILMQAVNNTVLRSMHLLPIRSYSPASLEVIAVWVAGKMFQVIRMLPMVPGG